MAEAKKSAPFDAGLVRQLAGLLDECQLAEIEYDSGSWRIRLSRQMAQPHVGLSAPASSAVVPPLRGAAAPEVAHPGLITSPMVGVCYITPEPDAPPFVKVGDMVNAGDTLLLIEAMKVFNPIKAERAGRVTQLFVVNGAPVEYGEPLLILE